MEDEDSSSTDTSESKPRPSKHKDILSMYYDCVNRASKIRKETHSFHNMAYRGEDFRGKELFSTSESSDASESEELTYEKMMNLIEQEKSRVPADDEHAAVSSGILATIVYAWLIRIVLGHQKKKSKKKGDVTLVSGDAQLADEPKLKKSSKHSREKSKGKKANLINALSVGGVNPMYSHEPQPLSTTPPMARASPPPSPRGAPSGSYPTTLKPLQQFMDTEISLHAPLEESKLSSPWPFHFLVREFVRYGIQVHLRGKMSCEDCSRQGPEGLGHESQPAYVSVSSCARLIVIHNSDD